MGEVLLCFVKRSAIMSDEAGEEKWQVAESFLQRQAVTNINTPEGTEPERGTVRVTQVHKQVCVQQHKQPITYSLIRKNLNNCKNNHLVLLLSLPVGVFHTFRLVLSILYFIQ